MNKNILVVAAHPDDEVLGCGGTMARLAGEGYHVETLILGEGITSRGNRRNTEANTLKLSSLRHDCKEANKILKVKKLTMGKFPDNRFDSVPLLEIVKFVEEVKEKIQPTTIFTHWGKDLNVDHQRTFQAMLAATRPQPGETVREIYVFATLSSTEWNFTESFTPDCFFDITRTIDLKLRAMSKYRNELRDYPHPRSLKGIEIAAAGMGMRVGLNYAEAFKTIRVVK